MLYCTCIYVVNCCKMKFGIAVTVLVCVVLCCLLSVCDGKPKEMYLYHPIDHFNYRADVSQTFRGRYFIEDVYWNGSGPLFFYTGNEGPIEQFMDNTGFVFTLAKEFGALVVFAEHRYYGKSLPFGDKSFVPSNIGYLSVEQALADYAMNIRTQRTYYPTITKVIAFGGSYGGMLSAWFRFKYPNVVDGALAGSAPIYFVGEDLIPATAFFEKVTEDFAGADPKCPQYVREGFAVILELANMGESGLKKITEDMNLCSQLKSTQVNDLIGWVRNAFTSLAMVDYPYPASFLAPLPAFPVKVSCQRILNEDNRLTGLAQAAGLFYNGTNGQLECFDIEKEYVSQCADPTGCGTGPAAESWDYQVCSEIRLKCTTNNKTDMFPPRGYDPSKYCSEKWGVKYRPGWMETQYWGKDILTASNIIFSNGDLDPWSIGGVRENLSDSLVAITIKSGAHHIDLRAPDDRDPADVTAARQKERDVIQQWLTS